MKRLKTERLSKQDNDTQRTGEAQGGWRNQPKAGMIIFDDSEFGDKKLKAAILNSLNDFATKGRESKQNLVVIKHVITDPQLKILQHEATSLTYFPAFGGAANVQKFLKNNGEEPEVIEALTTFDRPYPATATILRNSGNALLLPNDFVPVYDLQQQREAE
jgi:hypothetical protein